MCKVEKFSLGEQRTELKSKPLAVSSKTALRGCTELFDFRVGHNQFPAEQLHAFPIMDWAGLQATVAH